MCNYIKSEIVNSKIRNVFHASLQTIFKAHIKIFKCDLNILLKDNIQQHKRF